MAAIPDILQGGLLDSVILQYIAPLIAGLACPELTKWDNSVFGIYPGAQDHS